MENINERDTLPNLETILNAINSLRSEMNERFDKVEARLMNVEQRLTNVETDVSRVKELQFVFENEIDRLLALSHKSLELSHENRADVRIMRKEIQAWSYDVRELERKVA